MTNFNDKKYCIYGSGGMGCEAMLWLKDSLKISLHDLAKVAVFMVDDQYFIDARLLGIEVIKRSSFNPQLFKVVIAMGDQKIRKKLVEGLPKETEYFTIIHPDTLIYEDVTIGIGSIISPGSMLTYDIKIGTHCILNIGTSISHNCRIGDYFTASPKASIAGNVHIGDNVFLGLNALLRDDIRICSDVIIGMGCVVVKSILTSGTYISNPSRNIHSVKNTKE